eukprot:928067-Pleurochrysis_carterae.AAC.1
MKPAPALCWRALRSCSGTQLAEYRIKSTGLTIRCYMRSAVRGSSPCGIYRVCRKLCGARRIVTRLSGKMYSKHAQVGENACCTSLALYAAMR